MLLAGSVSIWVYLCARGGAADETGTPCVGVKQCIGRGYAHVKHLLSTYKALLENRKMAA